MIWIHGGGFMFGSGAGNEVIESQAYENGTGKANNTTNNKFMELTESQMLFFLRKINLKNFVFKLVLIKVLCRD